LSKSRVVIPVRVTRMIVCGRHWKNVNFSHDAGNYYSEPFWLTMRTGQDLSYFIELTLGRERVTGTVLAQAIP